MIQSQREPLNNRGNRLEPSLSARAPLLPDSVFTSAFPSRNGYAAFGVSTPESLATQRIDVLRSSQSRNLKLNTLEYCTDGISPSSKPALAAELASLIRESDKDFQIRFSACEALAKVDPKNPLLSSALKAFALPGCLARLKDLEATQRLNDSDDLLTFLLRNGDLSIFEKSLMLLIDLGIQDSEVQLMIESAIPAERKRLQAYIQKRSGG